MNGTIEWHQFKWKQQSLSGWLLTRLPLHHSWFSYIFSTTRLKSSSLRLYKAIVGRTPIHKTHQSGNFQTSSFWGHGYFTQQRTARQHPYHNKTNVFTVVVVVSLHYWNSRELDHLLVRFTFKARAWLVPGRGQLYNFDGKLFAYLVRIIVFLPLT